MEHHETFDFADAWWFRAPLRAVLLAVIVFCLLSLTPALTDTANPDHLRAIWGIAALAVFTVGAAAFIVAINDSFIEVTGDDIHVRFESFFRLTVPLADVAAVRVIAPRPAWRYRWGLATNWRDRISCSHGGTMVEIELVSAHHVPLWPRRLTVQRLWLAPRRHHDFVRALERVIATGRAAPPAPSAAGPPLSRAA